MNTYNKQIISLEDKIKQMEESLEVLQLKYEENKLLLNKLEPKAGQKRKRFWLEYN